MLNNYLFSKNYIISILFILAALGWICFIAPYLKKIPNNFSYQADILSLDNFYDERLHQFIGDQISKTTFSYSIKNELKNYLIINSFAVYKQSDEKIFSVTRLYYIDPYTWTHVSTVEKNRFGYLFSSSYSTKQPFYYWHVNYDTPAYMQFVNEEVIDGLKVYHYRATLQADQTANLTNLPDVPNKKGIITFVILNLWVEPITGWLVKYQDNATAYFYDQQTKEILNPWNQFSNRFTQTSIHKQTHIAKYLKLKYITSDVVIPILLLFFSFFTLFINEVKIVIDITLIQLYTYKKITISIAVITSVIVSLLILKNIYTPPEIPLIGIASWSANPEYTEVITGFKNGMADEGYIENKNIRFLNKSADGMIDKQIKIIESFLINNVSLIFTITTTGTLVAKGITTETPIVFAIVLYPVKVGLIASFESSKNNLVGSSYYINPAEQFQVLKQVYQQVSSVAFVHHTNEPNSEFQYREFKDLLKNRGVNVVNITGINKDDLLSELEKHHTEYNVIYFACDTLAQSVGGDLAVTFAKQYKTPSFACNKYTVLEGALIGYVADAFKIGKLAGRKAAAILNGAEPTWLRTETPSKGILLINLKTAKALDITVPEDLLMRADYVIK